MSPAVPCPRCGGVRDESESLHGLCPRCLLAESLGLEGSLVLTEGPAPEPSPAPSLAELAPHLPQLELEGLIARGGMGAVYRATQRNLARTVALKVLDRGIATRPGFTERFEREARALAQLTHPNIVTVHEHGTSGPFTWLVMEYVDGVSLRQMIRQRAVSPREALGIVLQICDALQFAHDHGVVHRDIKPENILVDRRGRVKILDFGLAKVLGRESGLLTRTSQVMGTPHYMAPEQWERPYEVDHRADIFALGVVFYELLTGELPIGRFAPPSRKVALDVRLDGVVLRTLEKEPELRYQQAEEVKTDVERIQGDATGPGRAPGAAPASVAPATAQPATPQAATAQPPETPLPSAPPSPAASKASTLRGRRKAREARLEAHRARREATRPAARLFGNVRAELRDFLLGVPLAVRLLVLLQALVLLLSGVLALLWFLLYT